MKKIIVGLGNPGISYQQTRHNAGALFLIFLQQLYHFPQFSMWRKNLSLLTRGVINGQEIILFFPQTFMNLSGEPVREFLSYYRLHSRDLLLVYDDLDLSLGKFQLSQKTPKNHHGVASVKQALKANETIDFTCLRLGVENRRVDKVISGADYLLQNFSPEESEIMANEVFPAALEKVLALWL